MPLNPSLLPQSLKTARLAAVLTLLLGLVGYAFPAARGNPVAFMAAIALPAWTWLSLGAAQKASPAGGSRLASRAGLLFALSALFAAGSFPLIKLLYDQWGVFGGALAATLPLFIALLGMGFLLAYLAEVALAQPQMDLSRRFHSLLIRHSVASVAMLGVFSGWSSIPSPIVLLGLVGYLTELFFLASFSTAVNELLFHLGKEPEAEAVGDDSLPSQV